MRSTLVVTILVTAFVSGCGTESIATGPVFPPRPADVRDAAVAPCSMLTPEQQREIGAEDAGERVATVNGQASPTCNWLTTGDLGYSVQAIPIAADAAVMEPQAAVILVNGFGAVRAIPRDRTGGTPFCQVTVDAAEGRSIRIQAQGTGARARSDDEMCAIATDVAGKVMSTVVAAAR